MGRSSHNSGSAVEPEQPTDNCSPECGGEACHMTPRCEQGCEHGVPLDRYCEECDHAEDPRGIEPEQPRCACQKCWPDGIAQGNDGVTCLHDTTTNIVEPSMNRPHRRDQESCVSYAMRCHEAGRLGERARIERIIEDARTYDAGWRGGTSEIIVHLLAAIRGGDDG